MSNNQTRSSSSVPSAPGPEEYIALQKKLFVTYEKMPRDWIERTQGREMIWAELGRELASLRSPPEALEALSKCLTTNVRMASEDGRRVVDVLRRVSEKCPRVFAPQV